MAIVLVRARELLSHEEVIGNRCFLTLSACVQMPLVLAREEDDGVEASLGITWAPIASDFINNAQQVHSRYFNGHVIKFYGVSFRHFQLEDQQE